jgi:hypothetical protein
VGWSQIARSRPFAWAVSGLMAAAAALLFVWFAMQVPIENTGLAFDWKIIWQAIRGGQVRWGEGMYTPPWAVVFVMPLGFLPMRAGWGLIIFLTASVLVASVPRGRSRSGYWLAVAVLITSFSALRNYADANLEAVLIGGVLLAVAGYRRSSPVLLALGALLATVKPQAALLLLIAVGLHAFRALPRRVLVKAGLAALAVAIPAWVWGGRAWLASLGTLPRGISLAGMLDGVGLPAAVILAAQAAVAGVTLALALRAGRTLAPVTMGLLVAGSMLAAPYTNDLTMLAALAVGAIALLVEAPAVGLPLVILYDLPYLFLLDPALYDRWLQPYWTAVLVVTWAALCVRVARRRPVPAGRPGVG